MSTLSSGVYWIQNVHSSTVLDLVDGSSANMTPVQGFQKRDLSDLWVPAQLWVVSQVGSGSDHVYTLENTNSRTYMDIPNGNSQNGTRVVGQATSGQQSQHWIIIRNSANTGYTIQNQASGTFIDLTNGSSENGTVVQGWAGDTNTTNPNQLWNFVRP